VDPRGTTPRSTGIYVFSLAASTAPPLKPIMHANRASSLAGNRATGTLAQTGEEDDL
jgi:hypothetical protein